MINKKKLMTILITAFCVLGAGQIGAETIQAANNSVSAVQQAINAAADGDTVVVPAGARSWGSNLHIPNHKGITLQGAGIGNTVITLNGVNIDLDTAEGNSPVRITGFTFKGGPSSSTSGAIHINDNDEGSKDWRIDNCRFDYTGGRPFNAIWVAGWTWGVVDHNEFNGTPRGVFVQMGFDDFRDPQYYGDYSWTQPIDWGGSKAVYIEDNTFFGATGDTDQAAEGRWGSRYVFRYNQVNDYEIDTHSGCENGHRGPVKVEIYNNVIAMDQTRHYRAVFLRGGTAVMFNNTISGHRNAIHIDFEQVWRSGIGPWANYNAIYPGQDQTGRGQDSGWGTSQASEPLYEWNNTFDGQDVDYTVLVDQTNEMLDFIQEGRDVFNDTPKPGYVPYEYPHPLTVGGSVETVQPPSGIRTIIF